MAHTSDFSKIILLLQLVTAINSHKHNGIQTNFSDKDYPNVLPELEALVAILSQGSDVIAAYYSSANTSVVVVESTSKTVPGVGLKIPEDGLEPKNPRPLTLNSVCSPDYTFAPGLNVDKQHRLTLVPEGDSYWDDVQRHEWCCALMYVSLFYGLFLIQLSLCEQESYSFVSACGNFSRISGSLRKTDKFPRTSRDIL
jgi:hypothetical protein